MVGKPIHNFHRIIGHAATVIVFIGVAFYMLVVFWPQSPPNTQARIEVSKGASLSGIATALRDQNIIGGTESFILAAQLMGYEKSIKAGIFSLSNVRSNFQIIHQLVNSTPLIKRITVPEGSRVEDVARIFQEQLKVHPQEFTVLCHDQTFIRSLDLDVPALEGFLFPETYYFPEGVKAATVVRTMVDQYHELLNDSLIDRAREFGLTEMEVVTLASIVEGEAVHDSERPIISAVYHNRLRKGMKLQADPTIQYIISDGPRRLLKKDLSIDSPYNTYLNPGLPPGPISSPGKESILAVLYPSDVDYLYFVANGDGSHTFSRTEKEHLEAKRKFQQYRRKVRREMRRQALEKVE